MRLTRTLLLALACCLAAAPALAADKLAPGDLAPDYLGHNIDGDDVHVADYAGRVVVITYWATWCPYCLKELPVLNNVQRLAGKERLAVVAINVEDRDVFRAARRALKEAMALNFIWDPGKRAQQAYGVSGLPHMVIIGGDGHIINVHVGYGEGALPEIADELNRALAAAAPAPTASAAGPAGQ